MEPSMKLEAAEGEEYFEANLPEMAFDDSSINDVELLLAHRQSLESGSLTPLLKQELRCKIQSRRLNEGKDELLVKFDNPRNCQLTEEDMERRERRREQNRRAAQRFRQKRKLEGSGVVQELQELLQINSILHARVVELQEEKQRLQHALEDHIAVCDHPFSFAECFLNMPYAAPHPPTTPPWRSGPVPRRPGPARATPIDHTPCASPGCCPLPCQVWPPPPRPH